MAYNKRQHLTDNINAIRLSFELERENRRATAAEQEVLRKYSGFGGLKFVLNPCESDEDKERWSESDRPYFELTRELFSEIRRSSVLTDEYHLYIRSIRSSVLSAFYTPQPVIDAISGALQAAGVEVHTFLDPSSGRGSFVQSFKDHVKNSGSLKITAFEKDLLTGKILKALYPDDDIHVDGYETISEKYRNHFDVASSNIPFGDFAVFDPVYSNSGSDANRQASKAIHNYFFLKTIDNVREGGIIAFITSQGVLDAPRNKEIRRAMMERSRLVGVVRFPNNLFADEAGTRVCINCTLHQRSLFFLWSITS
jgi:hypothetical protein